MSADAVPLAAPVAYRGADRRFAPSASAASAAGWVTVVAAVAIAGGLGLLAASSHDVQSAVVALRPVLRPALLSGAGILCLVVWRLSGRTRPAVVGVALLVVGLLSEAAVALDPVLPPVCAGCAGQTLPPALLRAAPALVAAGLLLWGRRVAEVTPVAHPARLLAVVALLVPAGCGAVVLLALRLDPGGATALSAAADAWRAGLWLALLAACGRAGSGSRLWLSDVLACLALSAAADAAAEAGVAAAVGAGGVLSVVAGLAAVRGAASELRGSLAQQSSDLHRLSIDVSDARRREHWARAEHEERLHEVRNVLAGLHGATSTLRRYEDRLDVGVRRRLEDAVSGELHRLEHLLDPVPVAALQAVLLEDALVGVLTAERELGAAPRAELHGHAVLARAQDLATIVSALLVNARTHAPRSPVLLRADRTGDEVRIRVDDAGPGVPLKLRQAVFERGERGAASAPGSGLGLYTARRLAEQMGGTLHVENRAGGGARFVLTLAAARRPASAALGTTQ